MPRILLAGIPIDGVTMERCVEIVDGYIASRTSHQLIAINAAKIVLAHQNPSFKDILERSDLNFVDGQPVRFAATLLGEMLPELISGHFLMNRLIDHAARMGYRVYFLGAQPHVVSKAVTTAVARYEGLQVAGWRDGYWRVADEPEVVQTIRRSKADILFVALGTPQKEVWLDKYKTQLETPVCLGVGGSFDVLAGYARVEPAWIRQLGLAWSYRLMQEPRRLWRRYATTNPAFIWIVLWEFLNRHMAEPGSKR